MIRCRLLLLSVAVLTAACSVVPISRQERPPATGDTLASRIDTPRTEPARPAPPPPAQPSRPAEPPKVTAEVPKPPPEPPKVPVEPPKVPVEPPRTSADAPRPSDNARLAEQIGRLAGDVSDIQNATAKLLATARDQEEQLRYLQRRVGELSTEVARQQEEQVVIQRRLMELSSPSRLGGRPADLPSARVVPPVAPVARGATAPPALDGNAAAPSAAPPGIALPPGGAPAWPEPRAPLGEHTTSITTPEDLHHAGLARYRAGDLDSALLIFYDLISSHPTHPLRESAQFLVGEILYAQKDPRGALAEFEELLAVSPNGPRTADGLLKIGMCLRDLGDEPRARAVWQRLVRDHPNSPAARQARVLLKSGRSG
jgi:TolA-binding protein